MCRIETQSYYNSYQKKIQIHDDEVSHSDEGSSFYSPRFRAFWEGTIDVNEIIDDDLLEELPNLKGTGSIRKFWDEYMKDEKEYYNLSSCDNINHSLCSLHNQYCYCDCESILDLANYPSSGIGDVKVSDFNPFSDYDYETLKNVTDEILKNWDLFQKVESVAGLSSNKFKWSVEQLNDKNKFKDLKIRDILSQWEIGIVDGFTKLDIVLRAISGSKTNDKILEGYNITTNLINEWNDFVDFVVKPKQKADPGVFSEFAATLIEASIRTKDFLLTTVGNIVSTIFSFIGDVIDCSKYPLQSRMDTLIDILQQKEDKKILTKYNFSYLLKDLKNYNRYGINLYKILDDLFGLSKEDADFYLEIISQVGTKSFIDILQDVDDSADFSLALKGISDGTISIKQLIDDIEKIYQVITGNDYEGKSFYLIFEEILLDLNHKPLKEVGVISEFFDDPGLNGSSDFDDFIAFVDKIDSSDSSTFAEIFEISSSEINSLKALGDFLISTNVANYLEKETNFTQLSKVFHSFGKIILLVTGQYTQYKKWFGPLTVLFDPIIEKINSIAKVFQKEGFQIPDVIGAIIPGGKELTNYVGQILIGIGSNKTIGDIFNSVDSNFLNLRETVKNLAQLEADKVKLSDLKDSFVIPNSRFRGKSSSNFFTIFPMDKFTQFAAIFTEANPNVTLNQIETESKFDLSIVKDFSSSSTTLFSEPITKYIDDVTGYNFEPLGITLANISEKTMNGKNVTVDDVNNLLINVTNVAPDEQKSVEEEDDYTGVIVGCVIGGVVLIALIILAIFFLKKKNSDNDDGEFTKNPEP